MRRFVLSADHLKLLRAANVGWDACEFGAPAIDCKRPYGNSDVIGDIGRILNVEPCGEHDDLHYTREQEDRMVQLHSETQTALQVVLASGSFEPGTYVAGDYRDDWRRA